jgi:hypothetical protein
VQSYFTTEFISKFARLISVAAIAALLAGGSLAQDREAQPTSISSARQTYDLNREITLVGIVVSFTLSSLTPPLGPRLVLQTPSGFTDVHLGDAHALLSAQFTIHPGDTLRIVGESVIFVDKAHFVARIVQKGTQAIAVRTTHGLPIPPTPKPDDKSPRKSGVVL